MRRRAPLERAGALTPRDRIWAAVRCFGPGIPFSVAEIMLLSGERADAPLDFGDGQRADTTIEYLRGLSRAGILVAEPDRNVKRHLRELRCYRLSRDVGVDAPRVDRHGNAVTQGIGRQQMWAAVRKMRGAFNWREVAMRCSHPIAEQECRYFLKFLARAGYLQVVQKAVSNKPALYAFVRSRDTGPRAPIVCRDKSVMDGNTGEIVFKGAVNDQ